MGRSGIGSGVRVEVVFRHVREELEEQLLEAKDEYASELLLDHDAYNRDCWRFG